MPYIRPKPAAQLAEHAPRGLQHLTTLRITGYLDPHEALLSILALCPNVTTLDLPNCRPVHDSAVSTTSTELIPRLQHIKGTSSLVKLFVPGRPVQRLSLVETKSTPQSSEEIFFPVASSSVAVEEINFVRSCWLPDCISTISRLFSDLGVSRIQFHDGR